MIPYLRKKLDVTNGLVVKFLTEIYSALASSNNARGRINSISNCDKKGKEKEKWLTHKHNGEAFE
jgi:hypothetical protein